MAGHHWIQPVLLESDVVRLEPMQLGHAGALAEAGVAPEIWQYMPRPPVRTVDEMRDWINTSLETARDGTQVPFTIFAKATNSAIGSTRFMDIRPADRGLEIGWTWVTPAHQRTPVNTHCKYLLMRHAFETLGAIRVQLKTDARNVKSQTAIQRIGGIREGVLRSQVIMPDGYRRDTVYFGILDHEWPAVKRALELKMRSAA